MHLHYTIPFEYFSFYRLSRDFVQLFLFPFIRMYVCVLENMYLHTKRRYLPYHLPRFLLPTFYLIIFLSVPEKKNYIYHARKRKTRISGNKKKNVKPFKNLL